MTLQELIDRTEIIELVSRLGVWLDEKRFDEARSILTEDATVTTPGGSVAGVDRVAAQARRNHVVPTQHVITNVLIDLDGDRATVGANLIAPSFMAPIHRDRYFSGASATPSRSSTPQMGGGSRGWSRSRS